MVLGAGQQPVEPTMGQPLAAFCFAICNGWLPSSCWQYRCWHSLYLVPGSGGGREKNEVQAYSEHRHMTTLTCKGVWEEGYFSALPGLTTGSVHNVYWIGTPRGRPNIPWAGFLVCKMVLSLGFLHTDYLLEISGGGFLRVLPLYAPFPQFLRFLCFPLPALIFTLWRCQLPTHRFPSCMIQSLDFIRRTLWGCLLAWAFC